MFKLKLGAIFGFALGWLGGTGRAATFWDEIQGSIQGSATRRTGGSGPVVVPDRPPTSQPAASREARAVTGVS